METKDYALNIKRSLYKFIAETIGASYYVNYSSPADEEIERRIANRVTNYWKWITLHWLSIGPGIYSISKLQVNCNSIIANDPYAKAVTEMCDDVLREMNVDTITLYDFSEYPEDPEDTENVLIPRFRGGPRPLPKSAENTVNSEAMDFDIHMFRESVLP